MTRSMLGWTDDELERFIAWMEENQEEIRGSTIKWTTYLKESVFADADHIDTKQIKSKYHNMKSLWQQAKQMQEQSGFGLTEADYSSSINSLNPAKSPNMARLTIINLLKP